MFIHNSIHGEYNFTNLKTTNFRRYLKRNKIKRSSIISLNITDTTLQNFYLLSFPNLQDLYIDYTTSITSLNHNKIPKLSYLSCNDSNIKSISSFQNLELIFCNYCTNLKKIKNLPNLTKLINKETPNLKYIKHTPNLKFVYINIPNNLKFVDCKEFIYYYRSLSSDSSDSGDSGDSGDSENYVIDNEIKKINSYNTILSLPLLTDTVHPLDYIHNSKLKSQILNK